jgi:hypothetical protein
LRQSPERAVFPRRPVSTILIFAIRRSELKARIS